MIRKTLRVLPLILVLPALVCRSAAHAQESFKLLSEKEIRARIVGKDVIDSSHWVMYLRPDGALFTDAMDRKLAGIWKIQNNKLCMSNPSGKFLDCNEVWMSGQNIRLRAHKDEETFDAVIEEHKTN